MQGNAIRCETNAADGVDGHRDAAAAETTVGSGVLLETQAPREADRDWSRLMARAQDGDRAAYHQLLRQVVPYLRSIVARRIVDRQDAEDVVQEILLTIHSIRRTYDPRRPFGPWLAAIAKRRVVDRLRQRRRMSGKVVDIGPLDETLAAPEANLHERISDVRGLKRAIEALPEGQRRAIELVKLKELSLNDAALASGMSVTALKAAGHRAVKALRAALTPKRGR